MNENSRIFSLNTVLVPEEASNLAVVRVHMMSSVSRLVDGILKPSEWKQVISTTGSTKPGTTPVIKLRWSCTVSPEEIG